MARECVPLTREAEQRGFGYLGYLQALLEQEVAQRHDNQLRQRLKAAAFPTDKRLEDVRLLARPVGAQDAPVGAGARGVPRGARLGRLLRLPAGSARRIS